METMSRWITKLFGQAPSIGQTSGTENDIGASSKQR